MNNTDLKNFKQNFAGNLNFLRTKRGLTLKALAAQLNAKYNSKLTRTLLNDYEAGRYFPINKTVNILADFFGVQPCDLLESFIGDKEAMKLGADLAPAQLRFLRKRQNLTQAEFVNAMRSIYKIPININDYVLWEKGKARPDELQSRCLLDYYNNLMNNKKSLSLSTANNNSINNNLNISNYSNHSPNSNNISINNQLTPKNEPALTDNQNIFIVADNAMSPVIKANHKVIYNQLPNYKTNDLVLVQVFNKTIVRELIYDINHIILKPYNPDYQNLSLTNKDNFQLLGKVIWIEA